MFRQFVPEAHQSLEQLVGGLCVVELGQLATPKTPDSSEGGGAYRDWASRYCRRSVYARHETESDMRNAPIERGPSCPQRICGKACSFSIQHLDHPHAHTSLRRPLSECLYQVPLVGQPLDLPDSDPALAREVEQRRRADTDAAASVEGSARTQQRRPPSAVVSDLRASRMSARCIRALGGERMGSYPHPGGTLT